MKESASKRPRKKTASENGELEYTPIRRRRNRGAGAVVLAEDEISVAYDSSSENVTEPLQTEPPLPTESADSMPEQVVVTDNEAHANDENALADEFSAPQEATENTENHESEEEITDTSDTAPVDSPVDTEAEDTVLAPDTENTVVPVQIAEAPTRDARFERVVLPDEISLVGVLPLDEEKETDSGPEPAEQTADGGADAEEEIPDAPQEDEEFVFTPMPTPVVYERVVLPDEISLVDVFPEFNIPTAQANDEAEVPEKSGEAEMPYTDNDEENSLAADSEPAEEQNTDESLIQISGDSIEQESPDALQEQAEAAQGDPLAAEFDFSEIDFDTLAVPETAQEDGEEASRQSAEPSADASLSEGGKEENETDSESEHTQESEDNEAEPTESAESMSVDSEQVNADDSASGDQQPTDAEPEQSAVCAEDIAAIDGDSYFPDAPKKKKEKAPEENQRPIESRFDIVELFAFTLALVFVITAFFFRSSTVKGSSMANTLHDGDQLILSSFLYEPEVGDIIVFEDYSTPHKEPLVKRVIATEGQTVEVLDAYTVLVDGVALPQEYVFVDGFDSTDYPIQHTVSEGHLFVMGDHRNASSDSRAFGEVAKSTVLGKVILRYYPFGDFKKF